MPEAEKMSFALSLQKNIMCPLFPILNTNTFTLEGNQVVFTVSSLFGCVPILCWEASCKCAVWLLHLCII